MDVFYCDICNAPMILENNLSKNHGGYRRRRFKCTVCDFKKVIHAGGDYDEKFIPEQGIYIVKKMFEQEEINREYSPGRAL